MGFINENDNNVRLTFTDYGKIKFLTEGYKNTFKYFSLSDDGVIYTLSVLPDGILDITGTHKSSTFKNGGKYKVR